MKEFFNKLLKGLKWFFKSFIWIVPLGILIDQVSKVLIYTYKPANLVVIPYLIAFRYCINTGAAFSLLAGHQWLLAVISAVGAAGIATYIGVTYKKLKVSYRICGLLILAGCMGNMIDRIFVFVPGTVYYDAGGVVDFLDFIFWPSFATFNVADSMLVVGVFLLMILIIIEEFKIFFYKQKVEDKRELVNNALKTAQNDETKKVYLNYIEEINKAVADSSKDELKAIIEKINQDESLTPKVEEPKDGNK